MTAQVPDVVVYRGRPRSIVGIRGSGLFDPADHGVRAVSFSSACWRGFECEYAVADGALLLTRVALGLSAEDDARADRDEGPHLFGRIPRHVLRHGRGARFDLQTWRCVEGEETSWPSEESILEGLREPVAFSGGLLLGSDFVQELYVHMGHPAAWKFREVHELIFESGILVEAHDRSARVAEVRARLPAESRDLLQCLAPSPRSSRRKIERWIRQCFSLDYSPL